MFESLIGKAPAKMCDCGAFAGSTSIAARRPSTVPSLMLFLDKNPQCLDILVTQDGTKNGIVVGWITNVMVLNAATI